MDSKCRFSAKPDEQMAATSCLIFLGPEAKTPTLDPSSSNSSSAKKKLKKKSDFNSLKGLLDQS